MADDADAMRLLQLLWAPGTKMGRSGVSLGAVVAKAVEIADGEGLGALTIRHLAAQVGVGAMTLYGYVPGKAELLELMLDRVAAEVYEGGPTPGECEDWQAGLRLVAQRGFEHGCAHPWVVEASPARPVLGPGHLGRYDLELAPLDGIGLDDKAMDEVLTHVLALAQHAARRETAARRVVGLPGLSHSQWWQVVGPQVGELAEGEDLPLATRVRRSVGASDNPADFLAAGVERVIESVERRLSW